MTPVNDLPVAADDAFEVNEDSDLSGDVRTNDDASGDGGNAWSLVQGAGNGLVEFTDGLFTYTPDPDYNGPDSFTYQLCDVDGDCDTATVSITVNPVNDLPEAVADAFEVGPAGSVSGDVSLNDTASPEGGNAWTLVTPPDNGTLDLAGDGSFTYTAAPGFEGSTSFVYALCDVDEDCSQATVSIEVLPTTVFSAAFESLPELRRTAPGEAAARGRPRGLRGRPLPHDGRGRRLPPTASPSLAALDFDQVTRKRGPLPWRAWTNTPKHPPIPQPWPAACWRRST